MIAIRGGGSIYGALLAILPPGEVAMSVGRTESPPMHAERYLFTAGVLHGQTVVDMPPEAVQETLDVNFVHVAEAIDRIVAGNPKARICVIGSESGISGSYDTIYSGAKAALHHYVCTKRLRTPEQQLVGIAPSIIGDGGMTLRRVDQERLSFRMEAHPKQRFLEAAEVAEMVRHLLYIDRGYISGTVIRMNGGEHTVGRVL